MKLLNTRYLQRFKIPSDIFDLLMYDYEDDLVNTSLGHGYINTEDNQHAIYYDSRKNIACVPMIRLAHYNLLDPGSHYMRRCVIIRSDNIELEELYAAPYASEARAYINKLLFKAGYTEDDIEQCLDSHTHEYTCPIHTILPDDYDADVVHEIHNCVYYDINNAHLDALCEIFPKAKPRFLALRRKIVKYKQQGELTKAQRLKDYVNFYCGDLGRTIRDANDKVTGYGKHRATYFWIVNRTREILQSAMNRVRGEIIYANTDGVIIHNPVNRLTTNDKLGEFKSEMSSDVVYAYQHIDPTNQTTPYLVYQYVNSKGKTEIKGYAPKILRNRIDLAQGKVVNYKEQRNENGVIEYANVTEEIKEISTWQE